MGYGEELVHAVSEDALARFGVILSAGETLARLPWRGSEPWSKATRAAYRARYPKAPLPAFSDGLGRPNQLLPGTPGAADPETEWPIWYIRGGRGSGKTRPAGEALAEWMLDEPGEYGVVAPTFGDARDTCIEGPSGLIRSLGGTSRFNWGPLIKKWNRSIGEMYLVNGSIVRIDGADDGAFRIQGKNLTGAWCDEVGLWKRRAKSGATDATEPWYLAWNESLGMAVRIGRARIIATGTPKQGHPLIKMLLNDPAVRKTLMATQDNAANLSPAFLKRQLDRWAGTRLGRQELGGEYLDDVEGALWSLAQIEADRMTMDEFLESGVDLVRVVEGVDPSGGVTETGIIKMGLGTDGHGYVFEDATAPGTPSIWGQAVIDCHYRDPEGDRVVPEKNQGGAMVTHVLRTIDPNIPIRGVTASRGKETRAEPISALCEQHKIHHVNSSPGDLAKLEDELTTWVPNTGMASPNRLDAYVWAATELFLSGRKRHDYAPITFGKESTWLGTNR